MKIFSFTLPLAVGGLAAWLTMGSMSQYAALVQPPLAPPGVDIPHCVDDTVRAHGLGEPARAAVRFAGAKQRARAVLHAACSKFRVASAVFFALDCTERRSGG